MNSLQICARAILPIFLITAAGYAAKRAGLIREDEVCLQGLPAGDVLL